MLGYQNYSEVVEFYLKSNKLEVLKTFLVSPKYSLVKNYLECNLVEIQSKLITEYRDKIFGELHIVFDSRETEKAKSIFFTLGNLIKQRQFEIRRYESLSEEILPFTFNNKQVDISEQFDLSIYDLSILHQSIIYKDVSETKLQDALRMIDEYFGLKEGEMNRCILSYEDTFKNTVVDYQIELLDDILQYIYLMFPAIQNDIEKFFQKNKSSYRNLEKEIFQTPFSDDKTNLKKETPVESFLDLFENKEIGEKIIGGLRKIEPCIITPEDKLIPGYKSHLVAFVDILQELGKINKTPKRNLYNLVIEHFDENISAKTFSSAKTNFKYQDYYENCKRVINSIQ